MPDGGRGYLRRGNGRRFLDLVAGIWQSGVESPMVIAKHIAGPPSWGNDENSFQMLMRVSGVVARALAGKKTGAIIRNPFPPGKSVQLPWCQEGDRIRCPLCRTLVYFVPCPACNMIGLSKLKEYPPYMGKKPKDARSPTTAAPGSLDRIQVYRARVSRGEAVFHDDDVVLV